MSSVHRDNQIVPSKMIEMVSSVTFKPLISNLNDRLKK